MRTLADILSEVRALSQADKLRQMHVLVHDLAGEAQISLSEPDAHHSVWLPYDSFDAADMRAGEVRALTLGDVTLEPGREAIHDPRSTQVRTALERS